ncbi:RNA polymerase-binding protein RbpA [soil metagenome]
MADRSLRGMRLGSQSLQSEEGVEFASRRKSIYRTVDGTTFNVTFSSDAEIPEIWSSPRTGQEGRLVADDGTLVPLDEVEAKAPRTHWDMLLERRTRPELEELLQERLDLLRARRGQGTKSGSRKSA